MTDHPYPLIASAQKGESFAKVLERLEQYEADAVILKVEFDWIKAGANNALEAAYKVLVQQPFFWNGGAKDLSFQEKEYIDHYFHPMCHTVAGALKRFQKLVQQGRAPGALRDAIIAFLTEAAPLGERVGALKSKIGKRPPAVTKTSIEREERDAKAMTCQCCARGILAETGVIAHHGYQRPGMGWQTDSCFGARALPFEVSRDNLGEYIEAIKARIERTEIAIIATTNETNKLAFTFQDKAKPRSYGRYDETTIFVNRATFPEALEVYRASAPYPAHRDPSFDRLKAERLANLEGELRHLQAHLIRQQGRYNGWKQTHRREGDAWVALECVA